MKPEIAVKDIPERADLLYKPNNEIMLEHMQKHPPIKPEGTQAQQQHAQKDIHNKQELAHTHDPSFDTEGPALSKYLNAPNTNSIRSSYLAVKQKQSAGYNIISNIWSLHSNPIFIMWHSQFLADLGSGRS